MPEAGELFHQDVPVLRTSLARHGLVDLPSSPPSRRPSLEVRVTGDGDFPHPMVEPLLSSPCELRRLYWHSESI